MVCTWHNAGFGSIQSSHRNSSISPSSSRICVEEEENKQSEICITCLLTTDLKDIECRGLVLAYLRDNWVLRFKFPDPLKYRSKPRIWSLLDVYCQILPGPVCDIPCFCVEPLIWNDTAAISWWNCYWVNGKPFSYCFMKQFTIYQQKIFLKIYIISFSIWSNLIQQVNPKWATLLCKLHCVS